MSIPLAKRRRTGLATAEYSKTVSREDLFDSDASSDSEPGEELDLDALPPDRLEASEDDSEDDLDLDVDDILEAEKLKVAAKAKLAKSERTKNRRPEPEPEPEPEPSTKSKPKPTKQKGLESKPTSASTVAKPTKPTPTPPTQQKPINPSPKHQPTFTDLGLSKWLTDQIQQMGIKSPSEIQTSCIPPILKGSDVVASARTGSGKTAAFALPILQRLSLDPFGIYALVLTPTRELAFQIAEQFRALGAGMNLRQAVIVGGMDMIKQSLELAKRPHVVVATPGRLVDHLTRSGSAIKLDRVEFLVLDEADRLLESTFADDLEVILGRCPKARQTLLFSATMTKEIGEVQEQSKQGDKKLFIHHAADRYDTVDKLDQRFLIVPNSIRETYLTYLLKNECAGKSVIIFVGKSLTCERLRVMLRELDIRSTAMHAQMTQSERISSLMKFKSGIIKVLLTTDVGSRGLDIPEVAVVINYDIAADATDYVHRVGRTARAGRGGMAIAMVTEHDVALLLNVEKKVGRKLVALEVPENKVLELLEGVTVAKRVASLHLTDTNFGQRWKVNKEKEKVLEKAEKRARKAEKAAGTD